MLIGTIKKNFWFNLNLDLRKIDFKFNVFLQLHSIKRALKNWCPKFRALAFPGEKISSPPPISFMSKQYSEQFHVV